MPSSRHRFAIGTLFGILLLAASACAGGSDAAVNPDGAASPPEGADAALLEFAQCMRDEGVDMPDPGPEGLGGLREQVDERSPAYVAALEVCGELLEDYYQQAHGPDHEDVERREAQMLERVQCMRDQGIDMPDPGPGGEHFEGLDPNDPAVRAAWDECFGDVGHGPGH
jgi:hypothetical protein